MTSNEIRFDCRQRQRGGYSVLSILPHIDGAPLTELIDSFEQPHRRTRDYTEFGPFRFDRHQYDDALRALNAAIGSAEA